MRKIGVRRRGDTNGDTRPPKLADSTHRRPRRTKAPAPLEGAEHRWVAGTGWRFRARMKVGGKIQVGTWTSREQAAADAAAMRERRAAGDDVQFVTLEEACQAVLDTARGRAGTWRSYHEHFVVICDYFGADTPLHEVTSDRVDEFLQARRAARIRGKPPSELRLRKHLGALGRVFRLAIRTKRFAGSNPLDRVEKPKTKRRHADVFDVDELGEMFKALHARTSAIAAWDAALVAALLFTGLRREGLCHVTADSIDMQSGFIRDLRQKRSTGSIVPVSKPLAFVLPVLLANADQTGHLVPAGTLRGPRKDGNAPRTDTERRTNTVDRVFRRCRGDLPEQLRARFHPHALRHSLRTILADAGVPEHVRNAITDHAPENIGRHYEHASPTKVRHYAARALDPLLWLVDPTAKRRKAAVR